MNIFGVEVVFSPSALLSLAPCCIIYRSYLRLITGPLSEARVFQDKLLWVVDELTAFSLTEEIAWHFFSVQPAWNGTEGEGGKSVCVGNVPRGGKPLLSWYSGCQWVRVIII